MIVLEELRAQIDIVRRKLAVAEGAGNAYEVDLHRARLADLMDIAARHGIELRGGDRLSAGVHTGRVDDDPELGTTQAAELSAGTKSPRTP